MNECNLNNKKVMGCCLVSSGGTDVDEPLWRSLRRLKEVGWSDADMLLVLAHTCFVTHTAELHTCFVTPTAELQKLLC